MGNIDITALLSASVGKVSVGDILTSVIVLVVCLVAVRLLLKLTRRLLGASSWTTGCRSTCCPVSGWCCISCPPSL